MILDTRVSYIDVTVMGQLCEVCTVSGHQHPQIIVLSDILFYQLSRTVV